MPTKICIRVVRTLLFLATLGADALACAQGSLMPPGAPAPTMKTLQQIELRRPIPGRLSASGYVISQPGSYCLTGNRTATGDMSAAISINARVTHP